MNKEIWKDIPNYEGLYQASNYGNVRSIANRWGKRKEPRLKKLTISNKGYYRIPLAKNNKIKHYMVHRLIYETFIGKIDCDKEINHKDYNRKNNKIENLEMITHKENVRYSNSKKVIQYDTRENFIKEWESIIDIERELKIDHRQISCCCHNKQKTCKNFIWKFKEE